MKRRTVLATLGSSALAAGCLGRSGAPGADDGTDTDTTDPGTDGTTGETPTDGTPTDGSLPIEPVADVDCPAQEGADRTVCWPHEDGGDANVWLSGSGVVLEPAADGEVGTLTFTLHNVAGESFGLNPYDWRIDRQTASGWEHVAPDVHIEPWTHVESGGTYEWVLSQQQHAAPGSETTQTVVQDLDAGTHAFTVSGILGGDDETAGERVTCTALFVVRER